MPGLLALFGANPASWLCCMALVGVPGFVYFTVKIVKILTEPKTATPPAPPPGGAPPTQAQPPVVAPPSQASRR